MVTAPGNYTIIPLSKIFPICFLLSYNKQSRQINNFGKKIVYKTAFGGRKFCLKGKIDSVLLIDKTAN